MHMIWPKKSRWSIILFIGGLVSMFRNNMPSILKVLIFNDAKERHIGSILGTYNSIVLSLVSFY